MCIGDEFSFSTIFIGEASITPPLDNQVERRMLLLIVRRKALS